MRFPVLTAATAVVLSAVPSVADDWTRFRGPNGTGVAPADTPTEVSATKNLLWKAELPGVGHSSPIVVGDRVFLQSSATDGSKRTLICLDATTGKELWSRDAAGQKARTHKKNTLASSTAAADDKRVYALFWDGSAVTMQAFTLAGEPVWSASLGSFSSQHGATMSPVVIGNKVIINYDQDGAAEVVAFDAATGEKVWATPRTPENACSSCPMVRDTADGKQEIVVGNTHGVGGYNADTGKANWEWAWTGNELRTVASPVLADGAVLMVAGNGGGTRAAAAVVPGVEPGSSAKVAWSSKRDVPYVPTPVVKGDHLYWIHDNGFAVCAVAKTGEVLWNERAFTKSVSASPILVGDKVLGVAEDGRVVVFKADPEAFEVVYEGDIDEPVFASPAAAGGKLFVRGTKHLFCFGTK